MTDSETPQSVVTQHGRLKRRTSFAGIGQLLAVVVVVAVLSAGSIVGYAVSNTLASIKPGITLQHLKNVPVPQVGSVTGEVNLLLTGSDTRSDQSGFQDSADLAGSSGTGNNDVTMVLHVSADHQHAAVISIPRDLLVTI